MPNWNVHREGPQWLADKDGRVIGVRDRRGRDWLFSQQESTPAATEGTADPIPPGGSGTGANLSQTVSPTGIQLNSDSGTDVLLPLATGTNSGLMAPAQFTKLAGIEANATADMTGPELVAAIDAQLGGAGWQAGAGGSLVVQEGDATVVSAAASLDFVAADFDVSETPAGEANIAISAAIARLASPGFTGTPTAPTAANGTNNTQLATTAFVQAAVALILNSAPGALDTLDELAAALGDDANFAATMTNALALKAPLASPGLTGTPTAPTAAAATDTTQLATTAYVRAEILSRVLTGLTAAGATAAPAAGDTQIAAWGKLLRLFNVLAGGGTGEILKKNSATNYDWSWAADGGSGGTSIAVQEGDSTVVATVSTLDFGAGFDVTETPAGEANIALDLSEVAPVVVVDATTARSLTAADNNKIIVFTSGSAVTVTVPTAFSGLSCVIMRAGAGTVTIAASGTTLIAPSLVLNAAGLSATILPTGTANEFTVNGMVGELDAAEEAIASAGTTTLANTASRNVSITGTTAITSFGNAPAGTFRQGRFTGILTLTAGANLILNNGGSNITTAAGDRFIAWTSAANTWVVTVFRATGKPVAALASTDLSDFTEAVQDVVGALVAAAGGSYNDAGNSISLPGGGYTDEQAQDAVAGAMVLPSGAYDDAGNAIRIPFTFTIACSDETTALTAGAGKVFFHMPFSMTVTAVMAGLTTAQTSGATFTVDVNEGAGAGTSILSTKLTIDNTEETSLTAAAAAVISDTALAKGSRMSVDIDQIGDGTAKGLKVYITGFITGF